MAQRTFEPCLIFHDASTLHLREAGAAFTLCQHRSLQGLQSGDKRRSWPMCSTCSEFAEDYQRVMGDEAA